MKELQMRLLCINKAIEILSKTQLNELLNEFLDIKTEINNKLHPM